MTVSITIKIPSGGHSASFSGVSAYMEVFEERRYRFLTNVRMSMKTRRGCVCLSAYEVTRIIIILLITIIVNNNNSSNNSNNNKL